MLLCALLRLPLDDEQLSALFSSVKNCGLTPQEQRENFELWLSELNPDERDEVQALMDQGKTFLEAMNSFRGRRNGECCA
jgi:hypothetical protein